jgi:hypothetical protein
MTATGSLYTLKSQYFRLIPFHVASAIVSSTITSCHSVCEVNPINAGTTYVEGGKLAFMPTSSRCSAARFEATS